MLYDEEESRGGSLLMLFLNGTMVLGNCHRCSYTNKKVSSTHKLTSIKFARLVNRFFNFLTFIYIYIYTCLVSLIVGFFTFIHKYLLQYPPRTLYAINNLVVLRFTVRFWSSLPHNFSSTPTLYDKISFVLQHDREVWAILWRDVNFFIQLNTREYYFLKRIQWFLHFLLNELINFNVFPILIDSRLFYERKNCMYEEEKRGEGCLGS